VGSGVNTVKLDVAFNLEVGPSLALELHIVRFLIYYT